MLAAFFRYFNIHLQCSTIMKYLMINLKLKYQVRSGPNPSFREEKDLLRTANHDYRCVKTCHTVGNSYDVNTLGIGQLGFETCGSGVNN